MRGDGIEPQPHMWSYVPLEQRIPGDHPLRALRAMVDVVLQELSPQFDQLYSKVGRPSIPSPRMRASSNGVARIVVHFSTMPDI